MEAGCWRDSCSLGTCNLSIEKWVWEALEVFLGIMHSFLLGYVT